MCFFVFFPLLVWRALTVTQCPGLLENTLNDLWHDGLARFQTWDLSSLAPLKGQRACEDVAVAQPPAKRHQQKQQQQQQNPLGCAGHACMFFTLFFFPLFPSICCFSSLSRSLPPASCLCHSTPSSSVSLFPFFPFFLHLSEAQQRRRALNRLSD